MAKLKCHYCTRTFTGKAAAAHRGSHERGHKNKPAAVKRRTTRAKRRAVGRVRVDRTSRRVIQLEVNERALMLEKDRVTRELEAVQAKLRAVDEALGAGKETTE